MRRISTFSASPGSAPSTKIGPFIGFGSGARCHALLVDAVRIDGLGDHRVAGGDREGGGRVPSTLCQRVGVKRCVVMTIGVTQLADRGKPRPSRRFGYSISNRPRFFSPSSVFIAAKSRSRSISQGL